jgi:membrane protein required for colicin V production
MPSADLVAISLLGLAALRGVWLGLVREVVSVVALVVACVAVRVFAAPAGDLLLAQTPLDLDPRVATVLGGLGIAVAVLLVGAIVGRVMRSGARAVGLGWLDRSAGGVLGAAEGALVVGLLLLVAAVALGRDHPALAESRAFTAVERLEEIAAGDGDALPAVAAPPPVRSQ